MTAPVGPAARLSAAAARCRAPGDVPWLARTPERLRTAVADLLDETAAQVRTVQVHPLSPDDDGTRTTGNSAATDRLADLIIGRPNTPEVRTPSGRRLTVKRVCNGCGGSLGDATDNELEAVAHGLPLPDVTDEHGCGSPS